MLTFGASMWKKTTYSIFKNISSLLHLESFISFRTSVLNAYVLSSSVGKESSYNAGDPGSIPGLGRSAGERIGYLLQYSWASLVVQLVKNLLVMQENWVWSLGWEDRLEKGKAIHSLFWSGEFHGLYSPWGPKESEMTEWLSLSHCTCLRCTAELFDTYIMKWLSQ